MKESDGQSSVFLNNKNNHYARRNRQKVSSSGVKEEIMGLLKAYRNLLL